MTVNNIVYAGAESFTLKQIRTPICSSSVTKWQSVLLSRVYMLHESRYWFTHFKVAKLLEASHLRRIPQFV